MVKNTLCRVLTARNRSIAPSYKALRTLIGVLGMALPFILVLMAWLVTGLPLQESISIYYYSNMGTFLTGILFTVGFFLVSYKGYNLIDHLVTTVTGIAGMGVASFPCFNILFEGERVGIFQLPIRSSDIFHLISAGLFFFLLAMNSLFLFTQTDGQGDLERKQKRNAVYIACGCVILAALGGLLFSMLFIPKAVTDRFHVVILLETVCLLAFGISWLTKGEAFLPDRKGYGKSSPR